MNINLMRGLGKHQSNGFTLVELLISLVVGLIVLAAILTMYVSMLRSNSDNLKSIRINQELRGIMSLITRDIRRAGANRNAASDVTSDPPTNPYSVAGGTRFTIEANQQGVEDACITYAYYHPGSSSPLDDPAYIPTNNDLFGFRLNSTTGAIETRTANAACNTGGWQTLSDPNLINITELLFESAPISTEDGAITIQQITVELSGQLRNDATVTRTIIETVKIRNEEF